jgi:protein-tyrosine phosphatase
MIDWHCHILPAIDDGPEEIGQSLAMAAELSAAGFTSVYCTPHLMRGRFDAGNDRVRRGVAELQRRLDDSGIPLALLAGREYCLDEYLLDALQDPLPLGDSRLVLVEILPHATAGMVRQVLYDVVRAGLTPVIAHPERCHLLEPKPAPDRRGLFPALQSLLWQTPHPAPRSSNALVDYLRDLGCCFQGNLGSFNGYYGRQVQSAAEAMRDMGLYDRYGSDLHAAGQAGIVLKGLP